MIKQAIFTLGLPGSGKSTFLSKLPMNGYKLVSADNIRVTHPDYDPDHPEELHELCVSLAESKMYDYADKDQNIVMDGGGINNHYTERIVTNLKRRGYLIEVVYINTPVSVCIARNKQRITNGERFVPTEVIIEKSYKLTDSVVRLKEIAHSFKEVKYFTNRHIFIDMDGVVAEYQELPIDESGDINFVSHTIFTHAKPVMEVIDKLKMLKFFDTTYYILSASPNSICSRQKREWIALHMPFIEKENVYFVGNKDFKHLMLKDLIFHLKLERKDCTLIDDDHFILDKVNKLEIRGIHPSKFLSNF
jgi:predicted ABC-type ATPase